LITFFRKWHFCDEKNIRNEKTRYYFCFFRLSRSLFFCRYAATLFRKHIDKKYLTATDGGTTGDQPPTEPKQIFLFRCRMAAKIPPLFLPPCGNHFFRKHIDKKYLAATDGRTMGDHPTKPKEIKVLADYL